MCRIAGVLVAIVLFSAAAGCGETPAEPLPLLPANIVAFGQGAFSCPSTCEFQGKHETPARVVLLLSEG